ncbi:Planctomycete cytochrome C [Thalassoglobus polymorphus]|uniref:Planctomycete cytochrome C n=2 Tax=Thalassoglobus polymorphus TaxID=2527994 RepID=A0A517QN33_9PLAN|nr:Planctomycete cytochrome C [Thalassoglobus polymorphus]
MLMFYRFNRFTLSMFAQASRLLILLTMILTVMLVGPILCAAELSAAPVIFERDVAPILENHCLRCHNKRDHRGGLSLQSREAAFQGGESGATIEPGDISSSYLIDLITPYDGVAEMPQESAPLSEKEISILRRWIDEGAKWPENVELELPSLWSLEPLEHPSPPEIARAPEDFPVRNPIDAFIAARHQDANLKPAPTADRHTLVRRLSLDLIGLPPSHEQVESFVNDASPDAYEKLVDEFLESPHFGEHWGRHWLDLARYADSEGYLGDSERPHAWVYREWVINAINDDLPFDQFSIEQLAGDLLENPTLEQKIATGFHRNTLRNTEAGVDLELYRTKEIIDRVNTTGMVWLGLTFGCAECHDHKHDPVSQKEFYQLYAFFNNADEIGVTATQPWEIAEYEENLKSWQPGWDELTTELVSFEKEGLTEEQRDEVKQIFKKYKKSTDLKKLESFYRTDETAWKAFEKRLARQLGKRPSKPSTKARAFTERKKDRRETFVHIRGVYNRPGEKVDLDTPEALPRLRARAETPDRLDLARWLFHEENPLTARVAVNRIWQQLFGVGIVSTPGDFGNKGAPPTHPLLLDWLASEYRTRGWSRKEMIRLIVNSSTYRMSSGFNSVPEQSELSNQLLWRQNSFRVTAETVRDLHLTASGLLDRTIGRKGIRPPLPDFVTEVGRSVKWPVSQGTERYRRGMYIFFKRTVPYPMLMTFDASDSATSCSRRERSNTPLQALTLLNDPVFYECAEVLGEEMAEENQDSPDLAIREIFLRCLGRPPRDAEFKYLLAAYHDLMLIDSPSNDSEESVRHNAMTGIARIVMNLDEFITRN